MSFKACRSFTSLNKAFPPPKMRGSTIRCTSSIRLRFIRLGIRVAPPRGYHISARLLLHFLDLFHITNDPCCLPYHLVQRLGKDDMGVLLARRAYAISFSVPLFGLSRSESQYCSYSGYIRRPRIKVSTELSVSSNSLHVSSSSAIAIHLPIGSFDETVHRRLQGRIYFSHCYFSPYA
jgi:hypothetical protein